MAINNFSDALNISKHSTCLHNMFLREKSLAMRIPDSIVVDDVDAVGSGGTQRGDVILP